MSEPVADSPAIAHPPPTDPPAMPAAPAVGIAVVLVLGVAAIVGSEFTLAEVAWAGGWSVDEVADQLEWARRAGLLLLSGATGQFESEDARREAAARLGTSRTVAVHDRLATLLERRQTIGPHSAAAGDAVERLARHAIRAGGLSAANTARALRWAPRAADRLSRAGRARAALALLDDVRPLTRDQPDLTLGLAHAWATLRAGRLAAARAEFAAAAALARERGDREAFARAAIGLGGLWVNEHRGSYEALRAATIWQDALAGLGSDHEVLRLRLQARIAAERAYLAVDPSAPRSELVAITARLRELGESAALTEVLALRMHVCLGPAEGPVRRDLVAEMVPTAFRSGDEHLVSVALFWATADAHLVGAPDADRQLAAFRERLAVVDNAALRYMSGLFDVQRAIRRGRWAEAEQLAAASLAVGLDVGDLDAHAYHAAQMLSIRWRQGRLAELGAPVDALATSPSIANGSVGFVAAQAAIAARSGEFDAARQALGRLPAGGVPAIPPGSGWLVTVCALVETADALDDRPLAQSCYDALQPFAGLPVVASLAAGYGPVERWLAMAAATVGRIDDALCHLHRAVDACVSTGETVLRDRLGAELDELRGRAVAGSAPMTVALCGRRWVVSMGAHRAVVPDLVGLRYLAHLAGRPGTGVPAVELAALARSVPAEVRSDQPVLDRTALTALRRRLVELESDIADAGTGHDAGRRTALAHEREAILAELGRVLNVRGASRSFPGPAERARVSVRKALVRAVDEVEAVDARLGTHLRAALRTGHVCSLHI
jgi:hypothetical protein